ncbi:MAG: FAD-dependent oxidoreductase [Myxococcota bacterium]|nr:FAD-dependent oxidoreductase [Myxococcota bacterium]
MIVIVGAGLAAVRAIESMRATGYTGGITLVGDEPHLPYERPPLSKEALRGEVPWSDLAIHPATFFAENRVDLVLDRAATALDVEAWHVELSGGARLSFDRLLVATGSAPVPLRVPGSELENVLVLRGLDHARALRERLLAAESVVVVGAGLVGLEVAAVARTMGKSVTVVERGPQPLDRLLGGHAIASTIATLHGEHGVELRTSVTIDAFDGQGRVRRARLSDGTSARADLVLVSIGIRPSTDWLASSGLAIDDGVLVDAFGATSAEGIYAAGDVARTKLPDGRTLRLETYGHAHSQGVAVGRTLAGEPTTYVPSVAASSEQFGVRIQIVGSIAREQRTTIRGSVEERSFAAFFVDAGRVTGALVVNRPRDVPLAKRLIESRALVDEHLLATMR